MPLRAESRRLFESGLRVVSIGVLAWLLWLSLDRGRGATAVTSRMTTLSESLRDWTRSGIAPDNISLSLDSVPGKSQRDWLVALEASGSRVSWQGNLPPVGMEVQAVVAPAGGYNILFGAPDRTSVIIADVIGPIDTVIAGAGGGRLSLPSASGPLSARAGGTNATAMLPDTLRIRRVLVLGSADWESKFVIAALEEDGWKVDAQTTVAPGVSVTQGSVGPIDTARYSAVIALDRSASTHGAEIVQYAANGGGVIIAGAAAAIENLSPLITGPAGKVQEASSLATEPGSVTLQSLSLMPIVGVKSDAVILARRGPMTAAAARRYGGGKVAQFGYLDTWRWRMSGTDGSVADHRRWWTNVVASVAYAPSGHAANMPNTDAAPVASLVESLGPASSGRAGSLASAAGSTTLWWLFTILSLSLLSEWISRRTRGER